MAPVNFKDWETVFPLVDRSVQCQEGTTLSIVRGWYQRENKSGVRDVLGHSGRAHIHIKNNVIIKVETVSFSGDVAFATRTSAAHHSRLGDSPWWTVAPGNEGCDFAAFCGCLPAAFSDDYVTLNVTGYEAACSPQQNRQHQQIGALMTKVETLQRRLGNNSSKKLGKMRDALGCILSQLQDSRAQEKSTRAELRNTRKQLAASRTRPKKKNKRRSSHHKEGKQTQKKPKCVINSGLEVEDSTEEV